MAGIWFEQLSFDITTNIQYFNKGNSIKPYITSFNVRIKARYEGINEEIGITVFPKSGKVLIEYFTKGNLTVIEGHIKYNGIPDFSSISIDHLDVPEYTKRVLKTVINNTVIHYNLMDTNSAIKEILGLNETPYDLSHSIKIQGAIWSENPYGNDLGKIKIDEIMNVDDITEYKVSHNWFVVQKDQDGNLVAIERKQGKETYNPFDQEILDGILPTKEDFEGLIKFTQNIEILNKEIF
jgi:hypothetical protein